MATQDVNILIGARLDRAESIKNINADLPKLASKLNKIKLTAELNFSKKAWQDQINLTVDKLKTVKVKLELDAKANVLNNELKAIAGRLNHIEVKIKIDTKAVDLNNQINVLSSRLRAIKVGLKIEASGSDLNTQLSKLQNRLKAIKAPVTLDTTRNGLREANAQIDSLNGKLKSVKLKVQLDNASLRQLQTFLQNLNSNGFGGSGGRSRRNGHGDGFLDQMGTAMERVPVWMAAMTVFYGSLRSLQSGIQYIVEVDSALVGLAKVTELNTKQLQNFALEANNMGNEVGKSTVEVIKAVTEFSRLGYQMNEAKALAKESLVYSTVGDVDIDTATKNIITTIKGFRIEVDKEATNVRKALDVFNEVGNNFAISSAGIGEALERSASSLYTAGNTLEQSVAMITAANSVVQDPNKVGTALKTISMRIRGISEDGEDLSDLMPTLERNFNKFGLSLKKDDQTFKSTYEIFNDLSTVWGNMSDFDKANIIEKVAGKLQGNVFASMMDNWQDAKDAFETGVESAGSATEEFNKTTESFAFKINEMKNAIGGFWQENMDTSAMKAILDFGVSAVKTFTEFTKTVGLAPPVVGLLTIGLFALNTGLRTTVIESWGVFAGITAMTGAITRATFATSALKFALSTFLPVAILMGAMYLLEKIIGAFQEASRKAKELEENNKKLAESYANNETKIKGLVEEFKKLNQEKDDTEKKGDIFDPKKAERLLAIQQEINRIAPQLVDSVDEQGQAHIKNISLLEQQLELAKKLAEQEAERAKLKFKDDMEDYVNKVQDATDKVSRLQDKVDQLSKKDFWDETSKENLEMRGVDPELARLKLLNEAKYELTQAQMEENKVRSTGTDIIAKAIGIMTGLSDVQRRLIDQEAVALVSETRTAEQYEEGRKKLEDYKKAMLDANDAIAKFKKQKEDGSLSQQGFEAGLSKLGKDLQKTWSDKKFNSDGLESILDIINELVQVTPKLADENNRLAKSYDSMESAQKDFGTATDKAKDYTKILKDLNDNHKLGADSIEMITGKYVDFLPYLNDEISLRGAIKGAIETQANAQLVAYRGMLENSQTFLNSMGKGYSQLFTSIGTLYGQDFTNFKTIAEAKSKVDAILVQKIGDNWSKLYDSQASALRAAANNLISANRGQRDANGNWFMPPEIQGEIDKLRNLANALDKVNSKIDVSVASFKNVSLPKLNSDYSGSDKKEKKKKPEDAVKKFLDTLKDDSANKYGLQLNAINQEMAELNGNTKQQLVLKLQEQNMLRALNKVYQENANKITAQMKKYKPTSEEYKKLREELYKYNLEIARNNFSIKELDKALIEHDRVLRQQIIDGENLVLQAIEDREAREKSKTEGRLAMEDLVLQAIQDRDEAERKALEDSTKRAEKEVKNINEKYDKILEKEKYAIEQEKKNFDKQYKIQSEAIEKEKKLLQKKYDEGKEEEDKATKMRELSELQKRYNKIALDNSGLYEKEKVDLQKEIADKQKEIAKDAQDKILKTEMDRLDGEQDALNNQKETREEQWASDLEKLEQMYGDKESLADNHYENLRLKELKYWKDIIETNETEMDKLEEKEKGYTAEVEQIMSGSYDSIIGFLKQYMSDYNEATKAGQADIEGAWLETYDKWQGNEQDHWDEVNKIMQGSQAEIIQFLKDNSEEYRKAGELQKQAYLEGWGETINLAKEGQTGQSSSQIKTEYNNATNKNTGSSGGSTPSKPTTPTKPTVPSNAKVSSVSGNLQYGSEGENVKRLQRALNALIGAGLAVDGDFKDKTKGAVVNFQRKYGIKQTGVVGDTTKAKFKALGYSEGGLVDYTGVAVVHGSKQKPESFLNAKQTKLFADLAKLMEKAPLNNINPLMSKFPQTSGVLVGGDINITNEINLNVPDGINSELDIEKVGDMISKVVDNKLDNVLKRNGINRGIKKFR